jgi:hypothetical protein
MSFLDAHTPGSNPSWFMVHGSWSLLSDAWDGPGEATVAVITRNAMNSTY